jgi:hypothetical protein
MVNGVRACALAGLPNPPMREFVASLWERYGRRRYSMHQHPDHDSDDAQRPHDGEGDKATLEKIHPDTPCSQGRHVSNVNYGSGFRVS